MLRFERRAFSADLDEDGVPDECAGQAYRRGDGNQDGRTDLSDAVFTLEALFDQGPAAPCTKALDADDDGRVQLTDALYVLNFLFLSGRPIPPPSTTCGPDPTPDALNCRAAPACAE